VSVQEICEKGGKDKDKKKKKDDKKKDADNDWGDDGWGDSGWNDDGWGSGGWGDDKKDDKEYLQGTLAVTQVIKALQSAIDDRKKHDAKEKDGPRNVAN